MIDYYTQPEDRLDEIELEILALDKLHLKTTRYLERLKLPEINNRNIRNGLVDLFHNVQFELKPILEAISDLEDEKKDIYEEIEDDPSDYQQHNTMYKAAQGT